MLIKKINKYNLFNNLDLMKKYLIKKLILNLKNK